jgi:hypothetical protein
MIQQVSSQTGQEIGWFGLTVLIFAYAVGGTSLLLLILKGLRRQARQRVTIKSHTEAAARAKDDKEKAKSLEEAFRNFTLADYSTNKNLAEEVDAFLDSLGNSDAAVKAEDKVNSAQAANFVAESMATEDELIEVDALARKIEQTTQRVAQHLGIDPYNTEKMLHNLLEKKHIDNGMYQKLSMPIIAARTKTESSIGIRVEQLDIKRILDEGAQVLPVFRLSMEKLISESPSPEKNDTQNEESG